VEYPYVFEYTPKAEAFFKKTKIFLKHSRKIEKVYKPGQSLKVKRETFIEPEGTLCSGSFFNIGAFSYSQSPLETATTGRYCSVSWNCRIMGIAHPLDRISTHVFTFRPYAVRGIRADYGKAPSAVPFDAEGAGVQIAHDVWIGQDVLLKPGIKIGTGAVVAAGSVVAKDVPPFAIVGGVPAKVIKYRLDEDVRQRVLRVEWWRYHVAEFAGLNVADPIAFLDGLEERIAAGTIQPYEPGMVNLAEELDVWLKEDASQ
jgi:acetyltransferase-like isoleucine patch superfamily enzyme